MKQMNSGALKAAKTRARRSTDRLSTLPDDLIQHILSFLDTKLAVQTCLLSTRWRSLRISLPNLTFNSRSFRKLACFDKFVAHVLGCLRKSEVCGFHFSRSGSTSRALLERLVKYAISHKVEGLSIDIRYYGSPEFMFKIFTCKSLKHLKVTGFYSFKDLPFALNLPALTTLHLQRVTFSETQSTGLFSNCLNLKNLTLFGCWFSYLETFNVSSPELAYLTIYQEGWRYWGEDICKLVISSPKLTSLSLKGFPPQKLCAQSLLSLEKVELDLFHPWDMLRRKKCVVSEVINIFQELGNAKSVILCSNTIEILSICPSLLEHQLSPFSNLKTLKLKLKRSANSTVPDHVMAYLLSCSPGVDVVREFS